ncbi:MAG: sensor histidine kinase [Hyphomicrobiales bacterium]|nr:sensor histidine kinase [Hyphomicrobiales bacterium]
MPPDGLSSEAGDARDSQAGGGEREETARESDTANPEAGRRRFTAPRWFSKSLARRIVSLNILGLVALLLSFMYLNQFRQGLIDSRKQSLKTQGEIIAAAIAASATVETDSITLDPERLLKLLPGEKYDGNSGSDSSLEFSINPERVGPVLRRIVSPTNTRARVYDRDGYLLVDSRSLADRSTILRFDLPAPDAPKSKGEWLRTVWGYIKNTFGAHLPLYKDIGLANGRAYQEIREALSGHASSVARANERGETIISVAIPIQRFRVVRGAVLLSTRGGDIDKIIASERSAMVRIFAVALLVMVVLSLVLAGQIAGPMRRLAEAADRVRRGTKSRQEIPDYTSRPDEIGHLSGALRDMTRALYNRIEAIESFAADVAHELKNPLTSLRSAVETLPIAKTDASRARLLEVIQHDVRRLDRLISDISNASRLDAELAREDTEPVDVVRLLEAVSEFANNAQRKDGVTIALDVAPAPAHLRQPYHIMGHDSRLGQVITNLVENARSFSEHNGSVRIALRRTRKKLAGASAQDCVEIIVDDDGPGIPDHALERIFERFYTDRPDQGFGQNSGLGLSISRQIVEAHGGVMQAQNRLRPGSKDVAGARFTVWLPAMVSRSNS